MTIPRSPSSGTLEGVLERVVATVPPRLPTLHLALAIECSAMLVLTLLWWKESILWVAFMSLYANVVGHWSANQATRAEEANGNPTS